VADPVDAGRSRALTWFFLVCAIGVAIAAAALVTGDPSRTTMWFTLASALISIYLLVTSLRRPAGRR